MSNGKKLNGTVIVTYRCNARCTMCNRYKAPSTLVDESHRNLSWINARGDLDKDEPCNTYMKEDKSFIEFI